MGNNRGFTDVRNISVYSGTIVFSELVAFFFLFLLRPADISINAGFVGRQCVIFINRLANDDWRAC